MAPYAAVTATTLLQSEIHKEVKCEDNVVYEMKQEKQDNVSTILGWKTSDLKWMNIFFLGLFHATLAWGLINFPYFSHLRLVAYGRYPFDSNTCI